MPLPKSFNPNNIRYYLWCLFCWNGLDIVFIISILLIFEFPYLYNYLLFDQYNEYCNEYLSYLDETCPSISFETGPALWLCLATSIGLYVIVHYTVFQSYDDIDDDLPSMQKTDEHYLGYSEAQPLNTSNQSANNRNNNDKKSTLSPPSTNSHHSHDITVNSQEVEYFESNDDATNEYFD